MADQKAKWWHAGAGYVLAGLILTFVHSLQAGFIDLAVLKQLYADNPCAKMGAK